MGKGLTSLLFSVGFACWLYYQLIRKTGGNSSMAIKAAIGAGLAVFFLVLSLMSFLPEPE